MWQPHPVPMQRQDSKKIKGEQCTTITTKVTELIPSMNMSRRLAPGLTELHCHATGPDRSHATFAPPCTHTREYPDSLTTFCTHAFCIGIAVEASEPRQLATATQVQGCPAVELEHPESLLVPFTVPSSSVPVLSEMVRAVAAWTFFSQAPHIYRASRCAKLSS